MVTRGYDVGDAEITVLFVDDYREYVLAGEEYLQKVDGSIAVLPETSPESALERLETAEVDCVVCDYEMPEMNGLAFLEAARERSPALPFVLLTGHEVDLPESATRPVDRTDVLQKGSGTHTFEQLRERIRAVVVPETGFDFDNARSDCDGEPSDERSAEPPVGQE